MKVSKNNRNQGFVTLISVIVAGAVGLSVAIALIILGIDSSKNALSLEESKKAKALVDACAEEALEKIRDSLLFAGGGGLSLESGTCGYLVTDQGGQNRLVQASGTAGTAIRKVTINLNQIRPRISIISWLEVPD